MIIEKLVIDNFKSIQHLSITCKKINVFIGEPDTGKSNILEALGLISALQSGGNIRDFVRYREISDIYYFKESKPVITIDGKRLEFYSERDYRVDKGLLPHFSIEIPVGAQNMACNPAYSPTGDWTKMLSDKCVNPSILRVPAGSTITFVNKDTASHAITFASNPLDSTTWKLGDPKFDSGLVPPNGKWDVVLEDTGVYPYVCYIHPWMIGKIIVDKDSTTTITPIRFYRFAIPSNMIPRGEYLYPPFGSNLTNILRHNRKVREFVTNVLNEYNLQLYVKENDIGIIVKTKPSTDQERIIEETIIVEIPYRGLSDGLQRLIFYASIILSNENAVITMEEPEAHIFPAFTKQLAELIVYSSNNNHNQFFITTHNPYFVLTLVEKCKIEDINIFIVDMDKERNTYVKLLTKEKIQQLLEYDYDLFFNINKLLDRE